MLELYEFWTRALRALEHRYENNIMDELSNNRSKLREESYEKAKRDKKKLKREGIAGQLNDDDEDVSPEDELFGWIIIFITDNNIYKNISLSFQASVFSNST